MSPTVNRSSTSFAAMRLSGLILVGLLLPQVSYVHAEQDVGNIAKPPQEIISFVDLNGDGIDDRSDLPDGQAMANSENPVDLMVDASLFQFQGIPESMQPNSVLFRQSIFLSASLVQYKGGMGALLDQQYSNGTGLGNAVLSNCVGGICYSQ